MINNLPKISIVTPSFNQVEFIEETILSVINQKYPNLEYIVIDGGSTDGSVEIIKKYEQYFSYWISEPDKGHADALNKGFARVTGEIMAWINSDDKYFPWAFQTIADVFTQHSDVNWVVGLYSNFDRQGRLMSGSNNVRAEYRNIYSYIFRDLHIQQESVFWRRSLWENAGGYIDTSVHYMIDTELWCRFFLLDELWHLDITLGGYRTYGINRFHVYKFEVEKDVNNSIEKMLAQMPLEKMKLLDKIAQFSADFKSYNKAVQETNASLHRNLILRVAPFFLYKKIYNYLYKKKLKKLNLKEPAKPEDATFVIRRLIKENNHWIKENIPYGFPY